MKKPAISSAHGIFRGQVWHSRSEPKTHSFRYALFLFALQIDRLPDLNLLWPLCGYNRRAIFSIFDRDYLAAGESSLKAKLLQRVNLEEGESSSVILLTMPRFLGYVFNPVSFYLFLREDKSVKRILAEVNNTFGEKHLYYPVDSRSLEDRSTVFIFPKRFYVSPLLHPCGEYELRIAPLNGLIDIQVTLRQDGRNVFGAKLAGNRLALKRAEVLGTLVRLPLCGVLAMSRIHFEALRMLLFKRAKIYPKPDPVSADTIRSHQRLVHRVRLRLLRLIDALGAEFVRYGNKFGFYRERS